MKTNLKPKRKAPRKTMSKYFPHVVSTTAAAGVLGFLFFGTNKHLDTSNLFDTLAPKREVARAAMPNPGFNPMEAEKLQAADEMMDKTALQLADDYLKQNKEVLQLRPYHELRAVEFKNPMGTRVKYSVFQDGVPVIGMGLELQVFPKGKVSVVGNDYRPIDKVDFSNVRKMDHVAVIELNRDKFIPVGGIPSTAENSTFIFLQEGSNSPELSYVMSMREKGEKSRQLEVVFRASDGQVLAKHYARSEF